MRVFLFSFEGESVEEAESFKLFSAGAKGNGEGRDESDTACCRTGDDGGALAGGARLESWGIVLGKLVCIRGRVMWGSV